MTERRITTPERVLVASGGEVAAVEADEAPEADS